MAMPKQDVVAVPAARLDERFFSLGTPLRGRAHVEVRAEACGRRRHPLISGGRFCPARSSASRTGPTTCGLVPDLDALDARLAVQVS